jgi:uncharacterized protein YcgL (UPF0745 family)
MTEKVKKALEYINWVMTQERITKLQVVSFERQWKEDILEQGYYLVFTPQGIKASNRHPEKLTKQRMELKERMTKLFTIDEVK